MSTNEWGGYVLPRADMLTRNRAGDHLLLYHPRAKFYISRNFGQFDVATFVFPYLSGVKHLARPEASFSIVAPDEDLGMSANDSVHRQANGSL